MRLIEVPLVPDTTAADVIAFCKEKLSGGENYCLAADFDGFDKQFGLDERLFHLVKKQILVKNHNNNVKFFLRKKKRVYEKIPSSSPTLTDNQSIQQSDSTSSVPLVESAKSEKMALSSNPNCSPPHHFSSLSYPDLIQLAERQKRQIESNNVVISHKETRLKTLRQQVQAQSTNESTVERLQKLRLQVQNEEAQLQRMRRLKLETEEESRKNVSAQTELQEARRLFAEKERQLKEAAERVEEMSRRLDALRRRRMLIAKEAELKRLDQKFDALTAKVNKPAQNVVSPMPQQLTFTPAANLPQKRPRAAIEPFKVVPPQQQQLFDSSAELRRNQTTSDRNQQNSALTSGYMTSKGFLTAVSAVEEALQQKDVVDSSTAVEIKPPPAYNERITGFNNFPSTKPYAKSSYAPNLKTSLLLNGYPTTSGAGSNNSDDGGSESGRKVNVSMSRRLHQQWTSTTAADLFDEAPPPDLIPAGEKTKYAAVAHAEHPATSGAAGSTSESNHLSSSMDPDKIAIRNDTMRAAKRRSWAEHHGGFTNDETEHIRMLLCREQQKGKSSVNLSWIFGQLANGSAGQILHTELKPTVHSEDSTTKNDASKTTTFDETPPPPPPCPPPELLPEENCGVERQEMRQLNDDETPPNMSLEDDDRSSVTIIEVVPEIDVKPAPCKGILRASNKESSGRRIRFDPLALLLDAALEGELELVKRCAGQIKNVSESNDEGITALHNAICAGHYEIVRFLVEADADVNAQDSDGWTPLHCAASCNNLPMVKFLVERGACVFATTISDHETPSDKCEEDEDGFDGCSQFLLAIQEKIGVLNGGRVYAAYDYDAQYEDELDFKVGDEMVVLNKSDKEKGWWWAKHASSTSEGYVPRNFLALYPRLSFQRALAMACEIEPSKLMEQTEKTSVSEKNNEAVEVNPLPVA